MTAERTRYYATRPRRVPPEFCTDEGLESCSLLAALLLYELAAISRKLDLILHLLMRSAAVR